MAQELLTTFAEEIGFVTLIPIGTVASLRCALMTRL
jgi:predicted Rdx family selenoprotein